MLWSSLVGRCGGAAVRRCAAAQRSGPGVVPLASPHLKTRSAATWLGAHHHHQHRAPPRSHHSSYGPPRVLFSCAAPVPPTRPAILVIRGAVTPPVSTSRATTRRLALPTRTLSSSSASGSAHPRGSRPRAPPKEETTTINAANERILLYTLSIVTATLGLCYASVPLYKVFCQQTGFGGTTQRADDGAAFEKLLHPVPGGRVLRVTFDGQVSSSLPWGFVPAQRDVRVVPGESALAFYTARNRSDKAITGIATYNVQPPKAGLYFTKIQCFCFDEQRLEPGEEVDMPVLFVIDPKFLDDPHLKRCSNITLSYHFFKTGEDDDDEDPELLAHLLEDASAAEEEEEEDDHGAPPDKKA